MQIRFWHGGSSCDKKYAAMVAKLKGMGCCQIPNEKWDIWNFPTKDPKHTSSEEFATFAEKWDEKFLAMRDEGEWWIYITQHGNFGQRG